MPMLSPFLLLLAAMASGTDPHPAVLVGIYDGNQTEMAAGLELRADGHFRYGLAYGALDEEAAGRWHADGNRVILDSDPVKPPHFGLLGQQPAPPATVRISLETPQGMDAQYFDAAVLFADGTRNGGQLSGDGISFTLKPGQRPASVRFRLGVFDLVSDPIAIDSSKGLALRFRFEPNDLGHVDFRGTALQEKEGELLLSRFDRVIHFRRGAH